MKLEWFRKLLVFDDFVQFLNNVFALLIRHWFGLLVTVLTDDGMGDLVRLLVVAGPGSLRHLR
jgi:hypothetical protein